MSYPGRGSGATRRRHGGRLPSLVADLFRLPALKKLPPREQEIAALVYLHTNMTAREVEIALSNVITNSAIRCMLVRLVKKGILRRRIDHGHAFIYSPALLLPDIQERALERVAQDYFGGSLYEASRRLMSMIERRDPATLIALSRLIEAAAAAGTPRLAAAG